MIQYNGSNSYRLLSNGWVEIVEKRGDEMYWYALVSPSSGAVVEIAAPYNQTIGGHDLSAAIDQVREGMRKSRGDEVNKLCLLKQELEKFNRKRRTWRK